MAIKVFVRENCVSKHEIVLRNPTINDIAVKIFVKDPTVRIERTECVLVSTSYLVIGFEKNSSNTSEKVNEVDIVIMARAIYPYNRKIIKSWLEGTIPDKQHNIVRSLRLIPDDSEFCAEKILIDLPGRASLVESTGYALQAKYMTPVLKQYLDAGMQPCTQAESNKVGQMKPLSAKKSPKKIRITQEPRQEPCFLEMFMKSFCSDEVKRVRRTPSQAAN